METEQQHFAIVRGDFQERELNGLLVFARNQKLQGGGGAFVGWLEGLIGFGIAKLVQAGEFLATRGVDDQVAGDGEEPGFKFGIGIVLMAALKDANPGFLEEVFGERRIAGEEEQITIEALLVLLDEAIEKVGIAAS